MFSFDVQRGKLARGRADLIPLRMPDVLPLWVARGLLLLKAHIIGAKFINGIKYLF